MENTSSLLLRRQILVDLGGWDRTRMGADSELYERVKARHNLVTNKLFPGVPLTLILFSGTSLTQTKAAGLATVNYGARRQYKEAYRFWHSTELSKAEPDLKMTAGAALPGTARDAGIQGADRRYRCDLRRKFRRSGSLVRSRYRRMDKACTVGTKARHFCIGQPFDGQRPTSCLRSARASRAASLRTSFRVRLSLATL